MQLDKGKTGALNRDQVTEFMKSILPKTTAADMDFLWAILNLDKSSTLPFKEFLRVCAILCLLLLRELP